MWKSNVNNSDVVTASTGLAAYNIGGVTVHQLFQLPIEHEGKTAGIMRANLRSLNNR